MSSKPSTDFEKDLNDFDKEISLETFKLGNDFTKEDVRNIVERLTIANESADIDLIHTLLEELLLMFGYDQVLPKMKVTGMESVGKSTLIESIVGLPINYSASDRATVAPVFIFVQKNTELDTDYKCTIRVRGGAEKDIKIEHIGQKIKEIMTSIKQEKKYSKVPLILKIQCKDPRTRSFSFIDLPGIIAADSEENDSTVVEGLKDVTFTSLRHNIEKDYVLFLQELQSNPSHQNLTVEFQKMFKDAAQIIPVCTKSDNFINHNDFKDTTQPNVIIHLKGIQKVNQQVPYIISLHKFTQKQSETLDFNDKIQQIKLLIPKNTDLVKAYFNKLIANTEGEDKIIAQEFATRIGLHELLDENF